MNPQYVVYITHYHGNLLPPFYIGYSTEAKVLAGYNGSVKSKRYKTIWCCERADHPELFKTEILSHHDTDLDARAREESLHRFYDVPNNPSFINMSIGMAKFGGAGPNNPMFGTHTHHSDATREKLKKPRKSPSHRKPTTEETKRKISLSKMGRSNGCTGKTYSNKGKPHSWEHNIAVSLSKLGKKQPTIECPHCHKIGGISLMKRWHFDNCTQ
jgi:hypothetical protein